MYTFINSAFLTSLNHIVISALVSQLYISKFSTRPQRIDCNFIGPDIVSHLQSFFHHRDLASLGFFYKYFHDKWSNMLSFFVPCSHEFKSPTRLVTKSYHRPSHQKKKEEKSKGNKNHNQTDIIRLPRFQKHGNI